MKQLTIIFTLSLALAFLFKISTPLNSKVLADPWPQSFPFYQPTPIPEYKFPDVTPLHAWAENAIYYLYNNQIMEGDDQGLFHPDKPVTREQLAKIITLFFSLPINDYETDDIFDDVDFTMWSYPYIQASYKHITGYMGLNQQKPLFYPYEYACREDVFVAVVKASGLSSSGKDQSQVLRKFKDSDHITYSLRPYVIIAAERGIAQGYEGYLNPKGQMTRAQLATLLYSTLKTIIE